MARTSTAAPGSVVIVGATSVIATETARIWVARGTRRFHLIGRDQAKLDALAADLTARAGGVEVTLHALDLTDTDAIVAEVVSVVETLPPDAVLIAHGVMHAQQRMQRDLSLVADELLVSGVSPVLWLEAFVDRLEELGSRCTVAVIGSVAGDRGRQGNYLYGATKALIETTVEGMQNRLAKVGRIAVVLVKPGPTRTPMTVHTAGGNFATATSVAADIADGIAAHRPVIYSPGRWRWIMLAVRVVPRSLFNRTDL